MSVRQALRVPCLCVVALLSGCAVGPAYNGPPAALTSIAPSQFHHGTHASVGDTVSTDWWKDFNDPTLNRLVDTALASNLDLAISKSRVLQAREGLKVTRENQLPSGKLQGSVTREQVAYAAFGFDPKSLGLKSAPLDLYDVEFDASWEVDAFGAQKHSIDISRAQANSARYRLADARVSLVADVVSTYIDLRAAQSRRALVDQEIKAAENTVDLIKLRVTNGVASQFDVSRAEQQLTTVRSALSPIDSQIDADTMALLVLCGRPPETQDAELFALGSLPKAPTRIKIANPAALIRNRPDVRIAESDIAADTARIGLATADLFPQISLQGGYGYDATTPSDIGNSNALQFSIGPKISWNFLGLAQTRARIHQADDRLDESLNGYHKAVLVALQDAEGSLSRLDHDFQHRDDLIAARDLAVKNANLAQLQYKEGSASILDLIDADRQRLAREDDLLTAEAAVGKDYAALSKAMGFGWAEARQ